MVYKDRQEDRHKDTGNKDTVTQRHGDTKTQRHKDTGTQRHRDTKTQGHKDTHNVFHPDIVCPPGRSPGVQVEITNISFNFPLYGFPNTQTVFVGSKQSFAYKTQSGTSYGSMTGCKVNFKVIPKFSKCICQLNDAEDEFLSLPGRVLPNI